MAAVSVKRSIRPFPSSPGLLHQNEVKCRAFDMELIIHSHANKAHFHKKDCALDLNLKVGVFAISEVAYLAEPGLVSIE